MYFGNVLRDTVGHNPLFEAQNIEHVGLMSEQASQKNPRELLEIRQAADSAGR